ncbi:hypothetical protein V6N00_13560 [Tersicoccus sp. MR15.9]|uniref:hypothetical protein n=1 Tax=Tersicoccus mangrovi TaxID=3121635 RepID=UPI002FE57354
MSTTSPVRALARPLELVTAASFDGRTRLTGCGWVLAHPTSTRSWPGGRYVDVGAHTAVEAELLALRVGLEAAFARFHGLADGTIPLVVHASSHTVARLVGDPGRAARRSTGFLAQRVATLIAGADVAVRVCRPAHRLTVGAEQLAALTRSNRAARLGVTACRVQYEQLCASIVAGYGQQSTVVARAA